MKEYTAPHKRVKTKYAIRGYITILAGATGEVLYLQDNGLGREMYYVKWDESQQKSPVFIEDVEVIAS